MRFLHPVPLRRLPVAALLLVVTAPRIIGPVAAQGTPLPPAEFREEIERLSGDTGPTLQLYEPESDTYTASRTTVTSQGTHHLAVSGFAQTQSIGGPSPGGPVLNVSGSATNSGPPGPAGAGIVVRTQVDYYFAVRASPTVNSISIILPLRWSLHATQSGQGISNARATISVQRMVANPSLLFAPFSEVASAGPGSSSIDNAGSVDIPLTVTNTASYGEYYRVRLLLTGFAFRDAGGGRQDAYGAFSGMLDPLPYVNPAFPGAESVGIEYSPNLFPAAASAPEPTSLVLTALTALATLTVGAPDLRRSKRLPFPTRRMSPQAIKPGD